MRKITPNMDKCTGCQICTLICSLNFRDGFNTHLSKIKIHLFDKGVFNSADVCQQCENAVCKKVCPAEAIEVDEDGVIKINNENCTGCGICVEECPYDAIWLNNVSNLAYKCELCGGEPQCVRYCPTNALVVIDQ